MGIAKLINNLARIYNKVLMTGITLIILILLLLKGLDPTQFSLTSTTGLLIMGLWILFALISLVYTLNGFMINAGFKKEANKFAKKGKPLKGVRGFEELLEALAKARNMSLFITLSAIMSFALFISIPSLSGFDPQTLASFALTMAFIAVAIVFLIELPEETSLDPGGLTGFYEPDMFPVTLDNVLSNVVLTYLDPVTYMKIDEYISTLGEMLDEHYESDETTLTRLERAFEKILLLAYLSNTIPKVVNRDVIESEIVEMIGSEDFDDFYEGSKTGLSWPELVRILKKVENNAPEVFRLIDRLLINITDNYEQFTSKDLFFTISAKTNQGSVRESSGAIVFFLNNTENENRRVNVVFDTDFHSIHPNHQEVEIGLDKQTDPYPKKQPEFIAEGYDVLSILSTILQVGDAVWFRFKPAGFGFRVIKIHAEDQFTGRVFGQSIEMKFTKSIKWYVKSYAPRLSALGGVAMPIIQQIFLV